jgi:uncharacterized SAM-binding protein YcdF (DUF218 family)
MLVGAAAIRPNGRTMVSRRTKAVVVGTAGASLALLILGFFLFAAFATRAVVDEPLRADGIVVLTGGEARIAEAGRLLEGGKARRLLISGVNRRTSREDLRRLTGARRQLFDCCVDIGYEALDTFGNADEARAWASQWQFSSLIIVTASYHMPRSLAEIALVMPGATLVPHPVIPRKLQGAPWWLRTDAARTLVSEYLKFLPVATRLAVARISGKRDQGAVADKSMPAGSASTLAGRL